MVAAESERNTTIQSPVKPGVMSSAAHLLPPSSLCISVLFKSFLGTTVSPVSFSSKFHRLVIS